MKVIEKTTNKILIEHENQRYIVTYDSYSNYQNGKLTPNELTQVGIPVSIKWSDFIDSIPTPEQIEQYLHQYGIHTVEDLQKNIQAVNGAIFASLGITASSLYKRVKQSKRN